MTLIDLREKLRAMEDKYRQVSLSISGVSVTVCEPPQEPCLVCGGDKWLVQKTEPRQGRTIAHGQFSAQATVHYCANGCKNSDGTKVTRHAESIINHLMPNSITGYDVMVLVGLKRFVEYRQREDIQTALLEKHSIRLSTGEISNLMKDFVGYLRWLHFDRASQLKNALIQDGGWPMHVDATGENGRGTLFVLIAGWRQWVLGSWKPSTERADLLVPCMMETVRYFGAPCAAMRDLGRAVIPAVNKVVERLNLDIPVFACHQHFLADIGKDLLGPPHTALRELFKRTSVRPKLRDLSRDLGRKLGESIDKTRKAVCDWQKHADAGHQIPSGLNGLAIVRVINQWVLDYAADATGLDFPFDRPYLDLYNRALIALRATDAFLRRQPDDPQVERALKHLHQRLSAVDSEVPFIQTVHRLRHRASLFDEMRNVFRMAAGPVENETPLELQNIHNRFEEWKDSLDHRRSSRGRGKDIREAIDIVRSHIERHGQNLWGHAIPLPERAGGGIRLVSRTNCLLENSFKYMKHGERRRSGRKILTKDLEFLPSEVALTWNLKKDDYVKIVCGTLDRLPAAFAELDQKQRIERQKGITQSDGKKSNLQLQIASASLSIPDRRLARTQEMNNRIKAAANSRAPKIQS